MADGGVFEDRQQFWRDHVAGWKSSSLSLRLYSERHGLKAGTVLRENPFSGHLFIFRGRAAHTIKVLMYDGSGFHLMQKRLTEGKFIWPNPADGIVTISRAVLFEGPAGCHTQEAI